MNYGRDDRITFGLPAFGDPQRGRSHTIGKALTGFFVVHSFAFQASLTARPETAKPPRSGGFARTLPVHRCRINTNWKTSGTANVIVIRRHTNGNFTYAAYLVDLLCLGVKDTYYNFNRFPDELENLLDDSESETEMMDIDYLLAHNIIYAGHDFATDYHIPQHPDFINITRYLLEEDDEKIALVDVHTGDENGMPHLVVTSSNREPTALARLKGYAGEGHYRYTVLQGEPFMEKDFDDDWEDVETDDDFDEEGLEDEDEEDPDFRTILDCAVKSP